MSSCHQVIKSYQPTNKDKYLSQVTGLPDWFLSPWRQMLG